MNIWTPPSHRFRGLAEARQAVQDYDSNLDFGINEQTGQWCVFLKRGTNALTAERDLPVLGFDHVPSRDEVQKRLYQTDAVRRGNEILDKIESSQDAYYDEQERRAREVDGEVAEYFEWGMRKMGSEKAPTKVFMNGS